MIHTFEQGICSTCMESLDWLADGKLRDRSFIGPKLPVDEAQGTFPLTLALMEMI